MGYSQIDMLKTKDLGKCFLIFELMRANKRGILPEVCNLNGSYSFNLLDGSFSNSRIEQPSPLNHEATATRTRFTADVDGGLCVARLARRLALGPTDLIHPRQPPHRKTRLRWHHRMKTYTDQTRDQYMPGAPSRKARQSRSIATGLSPVGMTASGSRRV